MAFPQRIRLARRHAGYSQARLAERVGVQRSAVSHWESTHGTSPTPERLQAVAIATGVSYEWLATGRCRMEIAPDVLLDSVPATTGLLIDDVAELRLIRAFRAAPVNPRMALLELVEALAQARTGRRPDDADEKAKKAKKGLSK